MDALSCTNNDVSIDDSMVLVTENGTLSILNTTFAINSFDIKGCEDGVFGPPAQVSLGEVVGGRGAPANRVMFQ